jgi:N-acetyl-anhydromuramyl-L-alanine amidase AmpD
MFRPGALTPFVPAIVVLAACASPETHENLTTLDEAFEAASNEFGVPRDLLVAIAYSLTRLEDGAEGVHEHEGARGFGIMDLGAGAPQDGPSIRRAAERLGVTQGRVMHDPVTNIRAAASELRWAADRLEDQTSTAIVRLRDWDVVVGWYTGSGNAAARQSFAHQVYLVLWDGIPEGAAALDLPPRAVDIPEMDPMSGPGLGDSVLIDNFVGAASCNFTNGGRTHSDIDTIVIHTAQGSYSGTSNWFQNCAAQASAHYVIRSSDGEITQMVLEADPAWHAGHWETNARSVGIELEGFVEQPETWYTYEMYESLAALVGDIADRQGVPLTETHIFGHSDVPGCSYPGGGGAGCHTDPGDGFDWGKLMALVGAAPLEQPESSPETPAAETEETEETEEENAAIPQTLSPAEGASLSGESVTMTWVDVDASIYELEIHWYDGATWRPYYTYNLSSTSKTFWPTVSATPYAWRVRGADTAWSELSHFFFEG